MTRKGGKKKKSNYNDFIKKENRTRALKTHLRKHPNDKDASKALKMVS